LLLPELARVVWLDAIEAVDENYLDTLLLPKLVSTRNDVHHALLGGVVDEELGRAQYLASRDQLFQALSADRALAEPVAVHFRLGTQQPFRQLGAWNLQAYEKNWPLSFQGNEARQVE
jgi:hypothetical protein